MNKKKRFVENIFLLLVNVYITLLAIYIQQGIFIEKNNICDIAINEVFIIVSIGVVTFINANKKRNSRMFLITSIVLTLIICLLGWYVFDNVVIIVSRKSLFVFIFIYTIILGISLVINYYWDILIHFMKTLRNELNDR